MEQPPYSQWRAMFAITRASFKAIFRSPSAIVFGIAFPLIFILIFGFIGNRGGPAVYRIAFDKGTDSSNALFDSLLASKNVRIVSYDTEAELEKDLRKGRLAGVLKIERNKEAELPPYLLRFRTTTASADKFPQFVALLQNTVNSISNARFANRPVYAGVASFDVQQVRAYKTIDFILPGQLGFSLLSAGVFGVAFIFFNLRQTLVLKRFSATPINRRFIVYGEGIARVLFQLITSVVILGIGHLAFGFTLVNGWITFAELLFLSLVGLLVFMGFGFVVSGLAKNESSIPPLANLITIPQFLLAGTFFSIDLFPSWLQPICRLLPLTYFNDAMRKVSFEGMRLWDVGKELGVLAIWGILVYVIAVRVFKWE